MKFTTQLDAEHYFQGLARQPIDFHQALGELIDNALSARKRKEWGDSLDTTLIEITVEEVDGGCILQVADPGLGITLEDLTNNVFNPGGQGRSNGAMNEHGFGLKNALALLTGGNKTSFVLSTRDEPRPGDSFYSVKGPLSTEMELCEETSRADWEKDLTHLRGAQTGTKIRVEVARRYLNTIYRKGTQFETLMKRLGEHLGVMYRHYIDENNEIRIAFRPKNGEWLHRKVQPIPIPYEGETKTITKKIMVGGKEYEFEYTRGILDYTVKDTEAEQEKGWPYPLKIYYQGSNARCGIDVIVRNRVILSGQFESLWPDISKTVSFNRFVGAIKIGPDFRTTNNKTGLDPHSENWEEILNCIQDSEFRPEEATKSHSEESLRAALVKILTGTFSGAKVRTDRTVWGGGADIDIDLDTGEERRIYELKVVPARVLDVYQLIMAWDGMVKEGARPNTGIVVAKEISETVKDAINSANQRLDQTGKNYKLEFKTIEELLPSWVADKINKPKIK